ncbi:nitrilase-related carbon-nitrogen hydrolase [Streptomyces sp. HNM0663]|uniref:Nitrilase-related carbon-nitrogen hydrolase n=1 Tax=Streptomyces chengmaiensis TaxID=3040919 RepID=A0ABT6HVM5_9ACTN|nr:nitrilase-related carbon-nitrogen hydrolase [Streptomyces chengmaiensis]MDH2391894.1 nitrilase-related carbon-nitrogen hydrolase [Streptomyces chengmaiensis]
MTESGPLTVAVMQATGIVGDATRNLATIEEFATRAVARGARLVVTPELFVSGYGPAAVADDDGALQRERLAAVARSAGVALVASTVDRQDGERFISASLFDGTGSELTRYHKMHLFGAAENTFFAPGRERPQVVDLHGVPVALGVCFDVEFPEFTRAAALSGAELLCVPTAVPLRPPVDGRPAPFDTRLVPGMVVPTRALESQIFIAYANHAGPAFAGLSCISDPYGRRVAAGETGEELVQGDVSRSVLRAARHDTDYLALRG